MGCGLGRALRGGGAPRRGHSRCWTGHGCSTVLLNSWPASFVRVSIAAISALGSGFEPRVEVGERSAGGRDPGAEGVTRGRAGDEQVRNGIGGGGEAEPAVGDLTARPRGRRCRRRRSRRRRRAGRSRGRRRRRGRRGRRRRRRCRSQRGRRRAGGRRDCRLRRTRSGVAQAGQAERTTACSSMPWQTPTTARGAADDGRASAAGESGDRERARSRRRDRDRGERSAAGRTPLRERVNGGARAVCSRALHGGIITMAGGRCGQPPTLPSRYPHDRAPCHVGRRAFHSRALPSGQA